MKDQEKQKLIELKHKILQQRISDTLETLKLMDKFIPCFKDIKSMEIISASYEKMYQAVLESEEYDKYQEIENTIIAEISRIESHLDKYIYKLAKNYSKYLDSIENSENYKNFHNLDIELEKIHALKILLSKGRPYHSETNLNNLKQKILELKFKILVRRQVEQIVYENGGIQSRLIQYEDKDEQTYFTTSVQKMMQMVKEDEVLQECEISRVMEANILANHLIFRLLEKDIQINAPKYIGLLQAPIFNPHFCTIANDPYSEKILYTKNLERSKVNLSLLLGVLRYIIGTENTTIVECSRIYQRFGFECKPIILNEGQEIVKQVFEKVKDNIKPKEKDTSKTQGRYGLLYVTAFNYEFKPSWIIKPIEETSLTFKGTKVLKSYNHLSSHYGSRWETRTHVRRDYKTLWNSYELDFKELKLRVKKMCIPSWSYESYSDRIGDWGKDYSKNYWNRMQSYTERRRIEDQPLSFKACINLDDISDLPIDFEKTYILTEQDMKEVYRIEENEEQR